MGVGGGMWILEWIHRCGETHGFLALYDSSEVNMWRSWQIASFDLLGLPP